MTESIQRPRQEPSLEEVVEELARISGQKVDAGRSVRDLGIDSLVLAEWLFGLQEQLGVTVDDDERLDELLELPLAQTYERLLAEAR